MSKEKRMLGNYEITQSIYVGDKEVVFGVDTKRPASLLWSAIVTTTTLCQQRGRQRVLLRTIIWKQCRFLLTEYSRRLTAPKRSLPNFPLTRPCLQRSIVSPMTVCVTSWVKWWLSIPSRSGMNISTPPISYIGRRRTRSNRRQRSSGVRNLSCHRRKSQMGKV